MTSNLGNCIRCGKLFLKFRDICPDCFQKQEDDYEKVSGYLRKHRTATISQVNEDTGVTITQIRQFILAGRISVTDLPNLSYPCESCGNLIREGKRCLSCHQTINQLSAQMEKSSQEQAKEKEKRTHSSVYKAIDRR
ncbi:TIGR03826 family flagellar region protein [Pseudoneobacillus sp. C159]